MLAIATTRKNNYTMRFKPHYSYEKIIKVEILIYVKISHTYINAALFEDSYTVRKILTLAF